MQMLPELWISCLQHCRPRGTAWPTASLGKHWENCTELAKLVPFQQILEGLWHAAAPPLHEPWHEECHRAQFFHHFHFNIYAKPPGNMMKYMGSNASHYVDNMQLHISFPPHADGTLPDRSMLKATVARLSEAEVRRDSSKPGWKWETLQTMS